MCTLWLYILQGLQGMTEYLNILIVVQYFVAIFVLYFLNLCQVMLSLITKLDLGTAHNIWFLTAAFQLYKLWISNILCGQCTFMIAYKNFIGIESNVFYLTNIALRHVLT
jgi:hypothetical protein